MVPLHSKTVAAARVLPRAGATPVFAAVYVDVYSSLYCIPILEIDQSDLKHGPVTAARDLPQAYF